MGASCGRACGLLSTALRLIRLDSDLARAEPRTLHAGFCLPPGGWPAAAAAVG